MKMISLSGGKKTHFHNGGCYSHFVVMVNSVERANNNNKQDVMEKGLQWMPCFSSRFADEVSMHCTWSHCEQKKKINMVAALEQSF